MSERTNRDDPGFRGGKQQNSCVKSPENPSSTSYIAAPGEGGHVLLEVLLRGQDRFQEILPVRQECAGWDDIIEGS